MTCQHHFILAEQNGPMTPAVCKHCGEEKSFPAAFVHDRVARVFQARDVRPRKRSVA